MSLHYWTLRFKLQLWIIDFYWERTTCFL